MHSTFEAVIRHFPELGFPCLIYVIGEARKSREEIHNDDLWSNQNLAKMTTEESFSPQTPRGRPPEKGRVPVRFVLPKIERSPAWQILTEY